MLGSIKNMIEDGYTSGHFPYWRLSPARELSETERKYVAWMVYQGHTYGYDPCYWYFETEESCYPTNSNNNVENVENDIEEENEFLEEDETEDVIDYSYGYGFIDEEVITHHFYLEDDEDY